MYLVGDYPRSVAIGDLDGDGAPDLAVVNGFDSSISVLINQCGVPACPADLDGSGDVGLEDVLAILSGWGPCDGCPEDLDGDGSNGFTDALAVLSSWGPCPPCECD